ncbi:C-type lectin domain family 4 member C-like [Myxocyprinus asiaticus]|uniref:C-type lectin domain family 4 member C-like n=1 Tax=Myxocyprinus asiaticus TaxID=70543 RepID=UPI002223B4BB|nr:C-type lectin domain family 4 member C-like [Myxocyprinus asiaticus]
MPENIYFNTFTQKSGSADTDENIICARDKRRAIYVILVLLSMSLLASAVLAYLYYTNDTNQLRACRPITNYSNTDLVERWILNKDRFYVFSNNTKDWNTSRKHCQAIGGDLVIINSKEEQEFLAQQIITINALMLHWIGLTDSQNEGVCLWMDNTPLNNNLSWWIFPPDDFDKNNPLGEDCAVLNGYLRGEKWGDISRLNQDRSVCEILCF